MPVHNIKHLKLFDSMNFKILAMKWYQMWEGNNNNNNNNSIFILSCLHLKKDKRVIATLWPVVHYTMLWCQMSKASLNRCNLMHDLTMDWICLITIVTHLVDCFSMFRRNLINNFMKIWVHIENFKMLGISQNALPCFHCLWLGYALRLFVTNRQSLN